MKASVPGILHPRKFRLEARLYWMWTCHAIVGTEIERQVVPQGVLLLCRLSRGRSTSNRAGLRGEICADAVCREPTLSSLLYALYRAVDTSVHGPDGRRVHRDDPR